MSLRISSSLTADQNSAHYIWYQRFDANLKAAVGTRLVLEFFPNSQLGKESDVVQQVKVGSIDIMVTGSSIWATVMPELGMLDLGYVFDSYAHVAKALDGGVGREAGGHAAQPHGMHHPGLGVPFRRAQRATRRVRSARLRS